MLKRVLLITIFILMFSIYPRVNIVSANGVVMGDLEIYKIYDEKFNLLFEKDRVEVGDNYLSKDYKFYEIVYLDDVNHTGIAKFIKYARRPQVDRSFSLNPIDANDRVICMYMTHNDESYVPTDGVDSVYGNGGIKDVALKFKHELEKYMINVHFDDTLHIPHDTSAYSRSEKTAKKLQNSYSPDAIFDIHRDGTSRKYYVTTVNGVEKGRVRMVIGKANPNMALNEEFAMYLMAIGNELYPWLFTDIYYAKGHYNQSLDSKAILFEMGCHLLEKEIVLESMDELAEVVATALYKTTVNTENGDLTINGEQTNNDVVVNEILDQKEEGNVSVLVLTIIVILLASTFVGAIIMFIINIKRKKN